MSTSTGSGSKIGQRPVLFRFYARNVQSNTMLNIDGNSTCGWQEAGAHDWTNPWQIWAATTISQNNDAFLIVNEQTGRFLVSRDGHNQVCLSTDNPDSADAHWKMDSLGGDVYKIWNVGQAHHVLDMAMGYSHNGCIVYSWTWHGGDNQKWNVTKKYN